MNLRKSYKQYCNENYIRFNLDHEQIWKHFEKEFGVERTERLSQIFEDRFENPEKKISVYDFCENFRETSVLMFFQSDFFLENSLKVIEFIENTKPKNVLELGSYNGILLNYLSNKNDEINFTGIDIEEKIINFAKEKFVKNNLKFIPISYEKLSKHEKKYDTIFSIFGVENIPSDIKYDKFDIRDNKNYFTKLNFFKEFFNNIKDVCQDKTTFLPLLRLPDLVTLLAFLDASYEYNWRLKGNEIEVIKSRNFHNEIENIPAFELEYKLENTSNNIIDIDHFLEITKNCRPKDNIRDVNSYIKNKDKFNKTIKEDKIFYEDDQNTLHYIINKNLGNYMMFLWATNGFSNYEEYNDLEDLKNSFNELTGKSLEL